MDGRCGAGCSIKPPGGCVIGYEEREKGESGREGENRYTWEEDGKVVGHEGCAKQSTDVLARLRMQVCGEVRVVLGVISIP